MRLCWPTIFPVRPVCPVPAFWKPCAGPWKRPSRPAVSVLCAGRAFVISSCLTATCCAAWSLKMRRMPCRRRSAAVCCTAMPAWPKPCSLWSEGKSALFLRNLAEGDEGGLGESALFRLLALPSPRKKLPSGHWRVVRCAERTRGCRSPVFVVSPMGLMSGASSGLIPACPWPGAGRVRQGPCARAAFFSLCGHAIDVPWFCPHPWR